MQCSRIRVITVALSRITGSLTREPGETGPDTGTDCKVMDRPPDDIPKQDWTGFLPDVQLLITFLNFRREIFRSGGYYCRFFANYRVPEGGKRGIGAL